MLWILALKSYKIEFHLIRVTIGLAVNSHRTLSPDIFFHEMLVCNSCVFTQLWSCQETWFCEQRNWALMVKILSSTFGNWISAASNLQKKKLWFIFLIITTDLVKVFFFVVVVNFLKAKSYFPLLSVKSPDSKFCLNQSSNWYGSKHHRALTWHHFSENDIISSMSVFTELWNCSKMFLWTWELGPDDKTPPPVKAG